MENPEVTKAFSLGAYATSRDHAKLAALARKCAVICVLDYRRGTGDDKDVIQDVAHTQFLGRGAEEYFSISARGTSYITAFNEEDFLKQCAALNVEFIEPLPGPQN